MDDKIEKPAPEGSEPDKKSTDRGPGLVSKMLAAQKAAAAHFSLEEFDKLSRTQLNVISDFSKLSQNDGSIKSALNFVLPGPSAYESKINKEYYEDRQKLLDEIEKIRKALAGRDQSDAEAKRQVSELTQKLGEHEKKGQLAHIIPKVSKRYHDTIQSDERFRDNFSNGKSIGAFVISIDIRKSTSLMLKAKSPQLFAEFIVVLCEKLKSIILERDGVFDKFTGDGVLAFFPDFMGKDLCSANAVGAAEECHRIFSDHYREYRSCFSAIYQDTGLGIGIDYGEVTMVNIGSEMTVVGEPVVYACRFGGGLPGETLCNQPAAEKLIEDIGEMIDIAETEVSIKHEGVFLAYKVRRRNEIGRS